MEKFYDALKQIKTMKFSLSSLSTNGDKKRFCSVLQDLAPDYGPECSWLKRILEKDIHLEFIDKEGVSLSEKKQIIGRVKKRLEIEEGFGEKAIEKMISALMVIGDWKESYRNNELYEAPNNAAKNSENIKTTKSSQTSRETQKKNVNKKNINSELSDNSQKSNVQSSSTKSSQNTNTAQQKGNTAQTGQTSHNTYASKVSVNQSATTQSSTQTQKTSQQSVLSSTKKNDSEVPRSILIMTIMTIVATILMTCAAIQNTSSTNSTVSTEMSEQEKEEKKAQEEKEAIADAQEGDIVIFGRDNSGNSLRWRVLSKKEKKVLLITENSVGDEKYHTTRESITWENCSLRKWLNEDFYNENFSDAEKKLIRKQKLSNIDDPAWGTEAGNDTEDKIFLLNLKEAEKYFTSNEDRNIGVNWWLRSPGAIEQAAKNVFSDGDFCEGNYYGTYVDVSLAVRPSLWVKISE
ncbi:MAG: DUF6273 domain-containing protein [Lachnospiraceae bacterium]